MTAKTKLVQEQSAGYRKTKRKENEGGGGGRDREETMKGKREQYMERG